MIWPFTKLKSLQKEMAEAKKLLAIRDENFSLLHDQLNSQAAIIQKLGSELEVGRMRLVACGVAAMSNTRESADQQRVKKDSPYYCASVGDVHAAVDREMQLREDLERAQYQVRAADESHMDSVAILTKTNEQLNLALDHMTSMMKGEADLVAALTFLNQHRSTKHCIKCGSEMIPLHGEDKKLCSNGACGHEIDWKLEDGQQYQYKRNVEPFVEDRSQSSLPPATNQQRL